MIVNEKKHNIESYKIKYRINLGIQILRMILCFWVITFHYSGKKNKKKILKTYYHVPTFMFISFYLSNKIYFTQNIIKIKNRLQRLFIPFLIIPIIDIIINNINLSYSKSIINIKKIVFNLLFQYITGYKIYIILWFVHNMLILTIFFEIIFYFFKEKSLFILIILIIISYWIQYSEINYKIFRKYKKNFLSVFRFAEMIPIASTGIILGSLNLLKKIEKHKIYYMIFCFIILFFTYKYNLFSDFKGFLFNGVQQNIASICLFVLFSLIPLEIFKNKIYINLIKIITNYTGGIYYFQTINYNILRKLIKSKVKTLFYCFIIYIMGYKICFIGSLIFKKNKLKYLFN